MSSMGCVRFQPLIRRLVHDPATAVPDDLALHLDACAECRRGFDATRIELDAAAFESLGVEQRRVLLGALAEARTALRRRRVSLAAAAVGVLFIGVALYLGGYGADRVAVALVEDHIRYLDHPDRSSTDDPAVLVAELGSHVDFPVRLPDLSPGRLTGGRRCYLLGRRVALAFYETAAGPVSYFVLGAEGLGRAGRACATQHGFGCSRVKGYRMVSWQNAGLLQAVVGPDSDALEAIAASARRATLDD